MEIYEQIAANKHTLTNAEALEIPNLCSQKAPVFSCSYDPPPPECISEYDPPNLYPLLQSSNSNYLSTASRPYNLAFQSPNDKMHIIPATSCKEINPCSSRLETASATTLYSSPVSHVFLQDNARLDEKEEYVHRYSENVNEYNACFREENVTYCHVLADSSLLQPKGQSVESMTETAKELPEYGGPCRNTCDSDLMTGFSDQTSTKDEAKETQTQSRYSSSAPEESDSSGRNACVSPLPSHKLTISNVPSDESTSPVYCDSSIFLSCQMSTDDFATVCSETFDSSDNSFLKSQSGSGTALNVDLPSSQRESELDSTKCSTPDTSRISPFTCDSCIESCSPSSSEQYQFTAPSPDSYDCNQLSSINDPSFISLSTGQSSDCTKRYSPLSTTGASVLSLPTDTITMNAGFDSSLTDVDADSLVFDAPTVVTTKFSQSSSVVLSPNLHCAVDSVATSENPPVTQEVLLSPHVKSSSPAHLIITSSVSVNASDTESSNCMRQNLYDEISLEKISAELKDNGWCISKTATGTSEIRGERTIEGSKNINGEISDISLTEDNERTPLLYQDSANCKKESFFESDSLEMKHPHLYSNYQDNFSQTDLKEIASMSSLHENQLTNKENAIMVEIPLLKSEYTEDPKLQHQKSLSPSSDNLSTMSSHSTKSSHSTIASCLNVQSICGENKVEADSIPSIKTVPSPPPRQDSSKIYAEFLTGPPVPPRPVEDYFVEAEFPSYLPVKSSMVQLSHSYLYHENSYPLPPPRQYVLIPVDSTFKIPEYPTPPPPPAPPRTSSWGRSPLSSSRVESVSTNSGRQSPADKEQQSSSHQSFTDEESALLQSLVTSCTTYSKGPESICCSVSTLSPVPEETSSRNSLCSPPRLCTLEYESICNLTLHDVGKERHESNQASIKSRMLATDNNTTCNSITPPPVPPPPLSNVLSVPLPRIPSLDNFSSSFFLTAQSVPTLSTLNPSSSLLHAKEGNPQDRSTDLHPNTYIKDNHDLEKFKMVKNNPRHSIQISSSPTIPLAVPPLPPSGSVAQRISKSSVMSVSPYGKLIINRTDLPLPTVEEEIRKAYTSAKTWGWIDPVLDTLSIYTQLRPIIQQGPQCGLVALSMASQLFPSTTSVEKLLLTAKEKKISNHGEMFSCSHMCQLAHTLEGMEATVERNLLRNPAELIDFLLRGNLILVPYDADHNHMPGMHSGRKAHWGIICGCLIQSEMLKLQPEKASAKSDDCIEGLWHYRPKSQVSRPASRKSLRPEGEDFSRPSSSLSIGESVCKRSVSPRENILSLLAPSESRGSSPSPANRASTTPTPFQRESSVVSVASTCASSMFGSTWKNCITNVVVLWRQGKSRNLILAPLADLRRSNEQLTDYADATSQYIISSVEEGLCCQCVVLHKSKHALSDLIGLLQESAERNMTV